MIGYPTYQFVRVNWKCLMATFWQRKVVKHILPRNGLVRKESKNKLPTDFDVNFSELDFTNTIHVKFLVDYDDMCSR